MDTNESKTNNTNVWQLRKEAKDALEKAKTMFETCEANTVPEKPKVQNHETKTKTIPNKTYKAHLALDMASSKLIEEIKSQIMTKKTHIETGLSHQVNFSNITVINVTGLVTVDFEGGAYNFSKERFLENRHFQNKVRDVFSKVLPNGWLVFFKGREEGTYCIKIVPRT
jgi:hypothetical protein